MGTALQAVSPPLCSWAALGCPCPQRSSAGIDEVLRVEWGENILPKSWGMLGTAQNGPLGTDFFLPPFESSYLFQFPKYGCKGLENWEGKVGREQPRLCLIRTLNPERFLIRLITAPMCLGEIFPSFSSHLWQKEILGGNKSMAQVLFGSSGTGCVPMRSHWFIGILPAGMGGAVGPALGCWFWAHPQGSAHPGSSRALGSRSWERGREEGTGWVWDVNPGVNPVGFLSCLGSGWESPKGNFSPLSQGVTPGATSWLCPGRGDLCPGGAGGGDAERAGVPRGCR